MKRVLALFSVVFLGLIESSAAAAPVKQDSIFVLDNQWKVVALNPANGGSSIVSTNQSFNEPQAMTIDHAGRLLVVDGGFVSPFNFPVKLIRIDPASTVEEVLSTNLPSVAQPVGLCVGTNGIIYILDNQWKVVGVNPTNFSSFVVSTNPAFNEPQAITVDNEGRLLVVDGGYVNPFTLPVKLIRINPATGFEEILTTNLSSVAQPVDLCVGTNGIIYVLDNQWKVVGFNPANGASLVVSTNAQFSEPQAMTVDREGRLIVVDGGFINPPGYTVPVKIFRINPTTGLEEVLATNLSSVAQPVGIQVKSIVSQIGSRPFHQPGGTSGFVFGNGDGISFNGWEQARFAVEATTNLVSSNWVVVTNALVFTNGQFLFTESQTGTNSQKFYRVISR